MRKQKSSSAPSEITFPPRYIVIGADLSLKRPGFAVVTVKETNGKATIVDTKVSSVNNKNDRKKTHGELLNDILLHFSPLSKTEGAFFVREKAIMDRKLPSERDLSKVVGITDWILWKEEKEWFEIYPVTIKKWIAGSGRADKQQVADALPYYVGNIEYHNDDESDAVAVAVAWLIQQGQIQPKKQE